MLAINWRYFLSRVQLSLFSQSQTSVFETDWRVIGAAPQPSVQFQNTARIEVLSGYCARYLQFSNGCPVYI